jgi:hypothetical protein
MNRRKDQWALPTRGRILGLSWLGPGYFSY